MKASELIAQIQKAIDTYGDLEIAVCGTEGDLYYAPSTVKEAGLLVCGPHPFELEIAGE